MGAQTCSVPSAGGTYGYGYAFKIPAGTNTVITLNSFNSSTGDPDSPLIEDAAGNLYGMTGSSGKVYEITPNDSLLPPPTRLAIR